MSENTPTEAWSHEELDAWAAERELELTGTKAEKVEQADAYLTQLESEETIEVPAEPAPEDDMPTPEAEPAPPAPGDDPEPEPGPDIQQEIADGLRAADGTVRPTVKKSARTKGTFSTGLAAANRQFKARAGGRA